MVFDITMDGINSKEPSSHHFDHHNMQYFLTKFHMSNIKCHARCAVPFS